jgi:hypothetical protein
MGYIIATLDKQFQRTDDAVQHLFAALLRETDVG